MSMKNVKISNQVSVEVEVSPRRLGRIFADMDSEQMAEFFLGVADNVKFYSGNPAMQWQCLHDCLKEERFAEARRVFKDIAEYAEGL